MPRPGWMSDEKRLTRAYQRSFVVLILTAASTAVLELPEGLEAAMFWIPMILLFALFVLFVRALFRIEAVKRDSD